MINENGSISINTENIFPIIKKWLYSEKDIFVRELVSNASDAISKFKKLVSIGEAEAADGAKYYIKVRVNKDSKTMEIEDNGIGMTSDEVKKYINQIAFSGAKDFVEKYKDKTDESQIIGHFGLGFYSAFMAADRVRIDTLSYQSGAEPVRWISSGGTEYELAASDKTGRGTLITLYMSEDSLEYLEEYKVREVLLKYCSYMPFEIYLEDTSKESLERAEKAKKEAEEKADKDTGELESPEAKPINDTQPLWLKSPKDCTDEEYKDFYRKAFYDYNEPLFWIHLNMDYPFNLKGILYFPKLKHEFETNEGQIKLFYNQVFVADNIKEVIPEFLMLLKGVLDCPDLPLNVSRSFLQNDGYVKKISAHITKKVSDKLTSLFENDRENYSKYWEDINPFVKYGCIRESKFFERMNKAIIYKSTNGDYVTLEEYLERNKEKHENKVFYVTDEGQQIQYINLFKEHGMEALILGTLIDNHFIQFLEMKESNIKFSRIDADLSDSLKDASEPDADDKGMNEKLEKLFKDSLNKEKLKIQVEGLKTDSISALMLLSEESRRMQEMSKMFGGMNMPNMFSPEETLVLNSRNILIRQLVALMDREDRKEDIKMLCEQVYDLAVMSHRQLEPEAMTRFIERSNKIMEKLASE